jgi:aspartate/methionine/tyrosine aminotransferase
VVVTSCAEDGWAHDLDALADLIRPATRLLYLNQPHNPTGTLMARPVLEHVIELARAHGLVVFSDEVYRELEHDPAGRLPPACDLYERAVSLGSISKSYGLPGLRIGWIATRDSVLRDAVSTLSTDGAESRMRAARMVCARSLLVSRA